MPEVKVGVPSVIEAALLPRLIGLGKAAELVLTGATLSAAEAVHCGLVACVVPRAELDGVVERWTHAILQAGPQAVRLQKALLQDWAQLPLEQAIDTWHCGVQRGVSHGGATRVDDPISPA